jgi:alkylated DNA repair dioxygenase AlkB
MYEPTLFDAPETDYAPEVVINHDGLATYDRYFLDPTRADHIFNALLSKAAWSQEFLNMYGKRIPFPRLTAWYGDPNASYSYSGVRNEPAAWLPELATLRNELLLRTGIRFNSVLLNQYRNGDDSLSWHSDNEPELGTEPTIASVSLGVSRLFELKHRTESTVVPIRLDHGSLLLMSGSLQAHWTHRIPKERAITRSRINLTFRVIDADLRAPKSLRLGRTKRSS